MTETEDAEICLCVQVTPTDRPFWEDIPLNRSHDPVVVLGANNTAGDMLLSPLKPKRRS